MKHNQEDENSEETNSKYTSDSGSPSNKNYPPVIAMKHVTSSARKEDLATVSEEECSFQVRPMEQILSQMNKLGHNLESLENKLTSMKPLQLKLDQLKKITN